MNKTNIRLALTLFLAGFLFLFTFSGKEAALTKQTETHKNTPSGLLKLVKAYPDFLDSASGNNLYWKDGTVMQYDDGMKDKDYEALLDNPDLKDQMMQPYTKGADWSSPPAENFEPGRIRYEPFFMKMYGSSAGEVQSHLVNINWMPRSVGKKVSITSVNGVDEKLQAISAELDELPADLKKYVTRLGGTFNWRVIAGTNRQSTHSFGIAIDINTTYSDYWQWDKSMTYHNKIPFEIVEIFEKHGFIWGGKWYHYDTMHFEYRPELLLDN
jgi:peptidoglycan L-alanyl-D-glutamate endopeptidase CwlK